MSVKNRQNRRGHVRRHSSPRDGQEHETSRHPESFEGGVFAASQARDAMTRILKLDEES